jgi:hypothetical protein
MLMGWFYSGRMGTIAARGAIILLRRFPAVGAPQRGAICSPFDGWTAALLESKKEGRPFNLPLIER